MPSKPICSICRQPILAGEPRYYSAGPEPGRVESYHDAVAYCLAAAVRRFLAMIRDFEVEVPQDFIDAIREEFNMPKEPKDAD